MLTEEEKWKKGQEIRRTIFGDDYVNKSNENITEITKPFYDLASEFAFGTVWSRPGLPYKTRSLINLAMLTALNRPDELELHIKGAINNGCTKEEIIEVFIQSIIYCGFPAAFESFRRAQKILGEVE
jgi:4-carboxymuconolactone decarboxylase